MTDRCEKYHREVSDALKVCEEFRKKTGDVQEEEVDYVISSGLLESLPAEPSPEPSGVEVFLRYGPYEACGIVEHRLHRLRGMQERLRKAGHKVHMEAIDDWNVVELWVHGEKVFKCDIRDLDYGSDGLLDGLCLEAVTRVEKAF